MAVYLIIARNRVQNGHEIRLPDPWLESISGTMFYPLAQSIYHTLEEQYGGYAMPRDEVAFLGILLFSMLDVNLKRDPFSLHPGFAGQAGRLRDRVLVYLKAGMTGLDFAALANGKGSAHADPIQSDRTNISMERTAQCSMTMFMNCNFWIARSVRN